MEKATTSGGGGGGTQPPRGVGLPLVEVQAAASLRRSEVLYVVKELLGFVLYMHHQIPAVLQNLENEFASLKEEMTEMALPPAEMKPSDQRKHNTRKREVRRRIEKQEKLMNGLSSVFSALQKALDEVPSIEGVLLILGGSLVRPLFVYDITISHGRFDAGSANEHGASKLAQSVSRKVVPLQMCIKCNIAGIQIDNQQITSILDASIARPTSSPGHGAASSPGHGANPLGLCNSPIPICGSSARGGGPPPEAGRPGSAMSALFNFNSFLTVVLLVICTCTYIKIQFPAILNDRTGVLVKIFYHGERLSPWVALGCFAMGISTIFF
uniref:Protein kish-A n=1 Tax=Oryza punctata TaxID=4537 RepID=A0A0E0L069_ORYPU